ncbi:MAG: OsmC family protein [Anaerolineae bacterium]|nr:OsmC family protein [Anaerolineae bacterium]
MEMVISFPGGACVDASVGDIVINTDQPPQGGGQGSAPTPFMLFLASLGTCAGIYVLSFCQQRGLPTAGMQIREHVEFDAATHMVKEVALHIDLPEGFPDKYRAALIKSAELCAVKRHLEQPPAFKVVTHPS